MAYFTIDKQVESMGFKSLKILRCISGGIARKGVFSLGNDFHSFFDVCWGVILRSGSAMVMLSGGSCSMVADMLRIMCIKYSNLIRYESRDSASGDDSRTPGI